MYTIVFSAKDLDYMAWFGYDHLAADKFDRNESCEEQTGPGKVFLGAPRCEFHGKINPAIVSMSPKGSITSEILACAIDKLGDLDVYPRVPGGPHPFILLDAHDS